MSGSAPTLDRRGRPLGTLRLSLTDRCNLRCVYCMPERDYVWLPREDLLSFEELETLTGHFLAAGARRVRLTGGEPLLRRDLPDLVARLARLPGLEDLALTTNGVLLADLAEPLRLAGLRRITVSLDTLDAARFVRLTRRDELPRVLAGIASARAARLPLKLDTVLLRGENDDEVQDLLDFARGIDAEIRFIEYMDVGGATRWSENRVLPGRELLARLAERDGAAPAALPRADPAAPAGSFRRANGQVFGVIASTTEPFCAACDRSRVTADGLWLLCLYAATGCDLREPLRSGRDRAWFLARLREIWGRRSDQGAVDRLRLREQRGPLLTIGSLAADPHREMHTRGG
jgi:cyclic pyranopterin phosphate synthase